jgi:hypothetical protein
MGNMFCELDKYCEGKCFELRNTHQTSQQGLLFHFSTILFLLHNTTSKLLRETKSIRTYLKSPQLILILSLLEPCTSSTVQLPIDSTQAPPS